MGLFSGPKYNGVPLSFVEVQRAEPTGTLDAGYRVARCIRVARAWHGYSKRQAAELCELSAPTYRHAERDGNVTVRTLRALSCGLRIELRYPYDPEILVQELQEQALRKGSGGE